jgi:hypothetical protein
VGGWVGLWSNEEGKQPYKKHFKKSNREMIEVENTIGGICSVRFLVVFLS